MRAAEQIRRASDRLAFVISEALEAVAHGRGPGSEAQLADALNAYGRAIAFLAEEETDAAHVGAEVPDLQSNTP